MKNKQLKIILLILLFIFVNLFSLSSLFQSHTKNFNDMLGTNETNITRILTRNENTGQYFSTTNKDKIKELINLLNNRNYSKSFNRLTVTGISYYYEFFAGDKEILRITGDSDNVNINGTCYNITKEMSVKLLHNWSNSLPNKK